MFYQNSYKLGSQAGIPAIFGQKILAWHVIPAQEDNCWLLFQHQSAMNRSRSFATNRPNCGKFRSLGKKKKKRRRNNKVIKPLASEGERGRERERDHSGTGPVSSSGIRKGVTSKGQKGKTVWKLPTMNNILLYVTHFPRWFSRSCEMTIRIDLNSRAKILQTNRNFSDFNHVRWQLTADHNRVTEPYTIIRRFLSFNIAGTISTDRDYRGVINLLFVLPILF